MNKRMVALLPQRRRPVFGAAPGYFLLRFMAFLPSLRHKWASWPLLLALLLASVCLLPAARAQGTYFNNRYSHDTTNFQTGITSIAVTDSGYVTFGQGDNYPLPGHKSLMLRGLDRAGNQRWRRYYGRTGRAYYSPIAGNGAAIPHPAGGFVMIGSVEVPPPAKTRPILWRFAANGDTLWTRSYPQATTRLGYAGCRTASGGYALVGTAARPNQPGGQLLLILTDPAGNVRWQNTYGAAFATIGYFISPTRDGGFLLSGYTFGSAASGRPSAPYVVKVNSRGGVEWERIFGDLTVKDGIGVARPTRDGGYLVAATRSRGTINTYEQRQAVFYKLDSAGQTQWERVMGPTRANFSFLSLFELPDGSFVGAGQHNDDDPANTAPLGNGYPEGFAVKICADGDSVWWRTYKKLTGGRSHNYLREFQPTPDGGFVGGGFLFAISPDSGSSDSWVFKVDSAGHLAPNGPPVTVACAPPPPPLGTGNGVPASGLPPPAVAVFPNPAPEGRFTVRGVAGATLTVTDAMGRRVRQQAAPAAETTLVDLSGQPAGLYMLHLHWPDGRRLTHSLLR